MKQTRILALSAFVALLSAAVVEADEFTIEARSGLVFSPANLTIQVGDTVTWINRGGRHNVAADDGSFRCANGCDGAGGNGSPSTDGWSFSLTFNDPGMIRYFCEVHGRVNGVGMSGILTVEGDDAPEPPDPEVPTKFNSGFEELDFADWDDRFCPSCNAVTAFLARRQVAVPAPAYRSVRPGVHEARLIGPAGTDFDLALERWDGSVWQSVATSDTREPSAELAHLGGVGRYRWVVSSESGHGNFRLIFRGPRAAAADPNELLQTKEAKKKGKFGLKLNFVAGSRNKDYLIDLLQLDSSQYDVSFVIRLAADLVVKGKKTILLQLRSRNKDVAHLRLLAPETEGGDFRLQLRARSGSRSRLIGEIGLKTGKFVKLRLVWAAASAEGAADGLVRLFRKKAKLLEAVDLDNDGDRVVELRLGQVSKTKRAMAGCVFIDVLKSSFQE